MRPRHPAKQHPHNSQAADTATRCIRRVFASSRHRTRSKTTTAGTLKREAKAHDSHAAAVAVQCVIDGREERQQLSGTPCSTQVEHDNVCLDPGMKHAPGIALIATIDCISAPSSTIRDSSWCGGGAPQTCLAGHVGTSLVDLRDPTFLSKLVDRLGLGASARRRELKRSR